MLAMLDELLVVFASLHLRDVVRLGALGRSFVLGGFGGGGLLGLAVTARPLRRVAPVRLLGLYAALPDRSGAVNAAGHLFTPLTIGLPWLLGWLADSRGTGAALLVLALQPVGLAVVAGYAARSMRPSA